MKKIYLQNARGPQAKTEQTPPTPPWHRKQPSAKHEGNNHEVSTPVASFHLHPFRISR